MNGNRTLGYLSGNFINNKIRTTGIGQGGALYLHIAKSNLIEKNFIGNRVISTGNVDGGTIREGGCGTIDEYVNSAFIYNYTDVKMSSGGGAIMQHSGYSKVLNDIFINNYSKSETGAAQGGAIWTSNDLNVIADNGT